MHWIHDMSHPLHQLRLHSHQLLHGHGLVHRRSIGISPIVAIVVVVVVVGLAIIPTIGTAPGVDMHLMYRNNIIKSGTVHMCKSDLEI